MKANATTANDIRCALRLRYPEGSHALLWEVANANDSNQRRFADAVAVGLWPSHGHEIEGIEIKVSRGDWLRECVQPEKSQPIYRFCNRWWLAVPKGLVEPDELPVTWGLLELAGHVHEGDALDQLHLRRTGMRSAPACCRVRLRQAWRYDRLLRGMLWRRSWARAVAHARSDRIDSKTDARALPAHSDQDGIVIDPALLSRAKMA